jgi:large subunit ribosomal protein L4
MQLDLFNIRGEIVGGIEVSDEVFGIKANEPVVHQALLRQLANKRLGTADTQTRGDVHRSSRKLYAQKHTGRARRGAADSPLLVGGGITFGPHPRSYRQDMPKKMRRLAIKSALSDKAQAGLLKIVDTMGEIEPKTKDVYNALLAMGIDTTVLIATTPDDANVVVASRNLTGVKTLPANLLNVVDVLSHKTLLMTKQALTVIEQVWGTGSSEEGTAEKNK